MDELNKDVFYYIVKKLNLSDLLNLSVCNKKLYNLISIRDDIWFYHLNKTYKEENLFKINQNDLLISSKELFKLIYCLTIVKERLFLGSNLSAIYNMKKIEVFNLNIKELPKQINILHNLETLALNFSSIKKLPKEIGELKNLQNLFMAYSKMQELPPEIGLSPNLKNISIHNTDIKELPKEIINLKNLKIIFMSENQIHKIPKEIKKKIAYN